MSRRFKSDRAANRDDSSASSSQLFRRNQTITGSSSRLVSSSNELNASMVSPRAHAHHLVRHRRRLGVRLVAVVIAMLATYLLVSQIVATVSILPSHNVVLPSDRTRLYQARIDSYFSSHPLERFYPKFSEEKLLDFLQDSYPEVSTVSLHLTGEFGKAQASVSFREPAARWVVDGKKKYVDDTGVVFAYTPYKSPSVLIVDDNEAFAESRMAITSERFLQFVGTAVGAMKKHGYKVTSAHVPVLTTRQLELRVKGEPYYIKMYIDRSAGEQAEDAARVIRHLKRNNLTPRYVDVRIDNKAFYK